VPRVAAAARWSALAAVFALFIGCSPTLDWRELRPTGSGIVLLLPCKPVPQVRPVRLDGQVVSLTMNACKAGGQTWALAHADVSDPTRLAPTLAELLVGVGNKLGAPSIGTGNTAVRSLAVKGATPHAGSQRQSLSGRLPDGTAVQAEVGVFVVGTTVLQATVLGPSLPADGVAMFFDSLRTAP